MRYDEAAPDLEEFLARVHAAYENLPAEFRVLCGDIVIHVAEVADRETLQALGMTDPMALSGLYEGVSLPNRAAIDGPADLPAQIHLYRAPILAEHRERGATNLDALVTHVLVHEIGHHFGFSDEDMDRVEASVS